MLRLYKRLKPYWLDLLLAAVFLFAGAIADLALPNKMAEILNKGVAAGDVSTIYRIGLSMIAISLFSSATAVCSTYVSSRAAMGFGRDLREEVFTKVTNFSIEDADKFGTSSLITRNTNDVNQVQMLIQMALRMLVSTPMRMIGGIIMAVSKDAPLSLILVVSMPLVLIFVITNIKLVTPLFDIMQKKLDAVNRIMREKLAGVRVIRAFNRDEHERVRFRTANVELTDTSLKAMRRMAILRPATMLIMNFSTVAVLWFGGFRVVDGMTTGDLMAFSQYIAQVLMSFEMATMMFQMFPRAAISGRRILAVLETETSIKDPVKPQSPSKDVFGKVRFDNVTFCYPGSDAPVLRNISFEANPGETVAIIGSTGAGKTTMISLIPRLYDVSEGAIYVDELDIRKMSQNELRSKIGFIPQKALLFTGSIADNIRYGKDDATDEEIAEACDIAQANEFIDSLPDRYDHIIAQDATNVSGGQKQRISIARAIVRRPEIYIFDDSFSALDFKTDANLRAALKSVTRDSTVLIVAQRVSTVLNADRIIVLEEGEMVGYGSHDDLMVTCPVYKEIVNSQISEEELA